MMNSGRRMMFVKKYFHKIIKEKEDWLKKLKVALMDVEEYITRMKSDGTNERLLIAFFFLLFGYNHNMKVKSWKPHSDFYSLGGWWSGSMKWGRFMFDDYIKEIFHMKDYFRYNGTMIHHF